MVCSPDGESTPNPNHVNNVGDTFIHQAAACGALLAGSCFGRLIQTSPGACRAMGLPCTNRSGCAIHAWSRAFWLMAISSRCLPEWTSAGVKCAEARETARQATCVPPAATSTRPAASAASSGSVSPATPDAPRHHATPRDAPHHHATRCASAHANPSVAVTARMHDFACFPRCLHHTSRPVELHSIRSAP